MLTLRFAQKFLAYLAKNQKRKNRVERKRKRKTSVSSFLPINKSSNNGILMRLVDIDNTSIKFYITEELRNDPKYIACWNRLDEGFFQPWQQHLKLLEAQLTADQVQQIFAAAEKEQTATGGNSTILGKIVEKIVPDSMLQKLSDNLPEPDPNAANDPQFQQKATQAVNALPVDAQTKGGLMQIVKNAVTNPAVQPIVLSLVGSVIGGLMSKVGPVIAVTFPGGGTVAAGVTGAIVAGAVAVAAAKIQGKSWKDAFKGAIKPALAGAAGAVVGKLAGDFISSIGSGDAKAAAVPAAGDGDIQKGLAADQAMQDRLLNKFPPDQGYTFGANGKSIEVYDANGTKVFTGDIPLKTMDPQTFADLTSQGKMATPGVSSGSISSDPMAGVTSTPAAPVAAAPATNTTTMVANEPVIAGQPLSQQQMAVVDMSKSMGNTPAPEVQAAYDLAKSGPSAATDTGSNLASNTADAASSAKPFGAGMDPDYLQRVVDAGGKSGVRFKISPEDAAKALDWQAQNGRQGLKQSREYTGHPLSEGQVYMIFNRVVTRNDRLLAEGWLAEGPMDWIKKTAKNLTTKVTADKLNKAWQAAGSPLDSEALSKILGDAGVNADVVKKVYADLKIGAEAQPQAMTVDQVNDLLAKLPVDRKVRLVNYMKNQLKVA
jgi:hypothetical protein